jgi:hypothetical protein
MLEVIEKLLILQDRDRALLRVRTELSKVVPERQRWETRRTQAQQQAESAKLRARQIESDRKKLELEADAHKQQIERYSLQQFQTKRNEEYRALSHEIETCRKAIRQLEDQQLELMERSEHALQEVQSAAQSTQQVLKMVEDQLALLETKEVNLKKELTALESNRSELAGAVDSDVRSRYERLFKNKGESVVVGVEHSVCGGCHMKLPPQVLVSTRAQRELVFCPNCGRILYHTREMDLLAAD